MSYATFTITPAGTTVTGGSYDLAGNTFGPLDAPYIAGWSLTTGTKYADGQLVFTCDSPGHQTEPSFDDSALTSDWDGTISTASFVDGTDFASGSPAVQVLQLNSAGSFPPVSGNWTLGDWTGDVNATPSPTGWTVDRTLYDLVNGSAAAITITNNANDSSATALSFDTSAVLGNDSNAWDGSISQQSFTPGVDDSPATYATQDVSCSSSGSNPPLSGTWYLNSDSADIAAYPSPSGWTVMSGQSLSAIVGGATGNYRAADTGSGKSQMTTNTVSVNMVTPAADTDFVDGSGTIALSTTCTGEGLLTADVTVTIALSTTCTGEGLLTADVTVTKALSTTCTGEGLLTAELQVSDSPAVLMAANKRWEVEYAGTTWLADPIEQFAVEFQNTTWVSESEG